MSKKCFEISVYYKNKAYALKTVEAISAIMNREFTESDIDKGREFAGVWRLYVTHFTIDKSYGKVMALEGVQTIRPLR